MYTTEKPAWEGASIFPYSLLRNNDIAAFYKTGGFHIDLTIA